MFFAVLPAHAQRAANAPPSSEDQTARQFNRRLEQSRTQLARKSQPAIDQYRIGPDDLLDISVFEAPEMNCTSRVSANGDISMQLLGQVKAAGLTPQGLESVIEELLRRTYMKNPHVTVFVRELQSHPVSVVGAVKMPGVFQIRGAKTVIEMLSMAQGLADDAGDTVLIMRGGAASGTEGSPIQASGQSGGAAVARSRGQAFRDGGVNSSTQASQSKIVEINLKSLLESTNPALNVLVYPGDIVKVTRAGIVYVVGDVKKPGGFALKSNESISVLQAVALAEGMTRTSAKSRARIIRTDLTTGKRVEIPVDLGKILASKAPDPLLQPKDIVFIPDSSAKSAFYRGAEAVLYTATGVVIYRR
ncbi:MAG TPA: polysaccharide biosynthesis/export family protein [Candidatus Dormibacteraeota bacterium]|nr:polysaccharide biosynthesis/export family protein [Candidatus Dormibacteraeota bacterium]